MKMRSYLLLFVLGFLPVLVVSFFQKAPGYMDAEYYLVGGQRLVEGFGFTEPFLWNYLDDPKGVPHPSHGYWMPMTSILAALSMWITGNDGFAGAKLFFLIVAGMIPVLSAAMAYSLRSKKESAWLAGIIACLPGFYLPYLGTTDAFGLYMLLGAAWLLILTSMKETRSRLQAGLLGLVSGLMHLTRADGIVWLLVALLAITWLDKRRGTGGRSAWLLVISDGLVCILGYLVVMGPWFGRNLLVFGSPLATGGFRSLWLTRYDELYTYPAAGLNLAHWSASGLPDILQARFQSLGLNLQTAFVVQGMIFLVPLIILGLWRYRGELIVRCGLLGWVFTLLLMSFVFPFVGWRGGFFHSGAALQPLFWAVTPEGFERFISVGVRLRKWNPVQAGIVFKVGLILLAIGVTGWVSYRRVIGHDPSGWAWNASYQTYKQLNEFLKEAGIASEELVLVNNPPGFYLATGRPAISIPDGDEHVMINAAHHYGARYLILDSNHPVGLSELYEHPGDRPGLIWIDTWRGIYLYRIGN